MRDPDALIERAGIRPDRRRDQHFLVDDRVLNRIAEYASALDLAHTLEIGAGTGGLTDRLLAAAEHVTAIERDPRLADFLRREFADDVDEGRLTVIEGDALDTDLPAFTASVSNLPYGASSQLLFRLLPERRPLVVMLQAEFADRMAATPDTPEYGRLSVTAQHYADVDVLEYVPAEAFDPPPAVESAIVRTTPRDPTYAVDDEEHFLDFVRAVFTQRRKTLRNAVRNTAHISGLEDPDAALAAIDADLLDRRPGELPPETLARVAARLHGDPAA